MQLPPGTTLPGSTPPDSVQHQQQQQMTGQHREGQVGAWPLQGGLQQGSALLPHQQQQQQAVGVQGLSTWQATAADAERMQHRPASVPADSTGGFCLHRLPASGFGKASACHACGSRNMLCDAIFRLHVWSGLI